MLEEQVLQHLKKHRRQHDFGGVESVLGGLPMIGEKLSAFNPKKSSLNTYFHIVATFLRFCQVIFSDET
jgi:hypothetical protein